MACEQHIKGNFITVIPDGSSDWNSKDTWPNGLRVWYILFWPSAANDVICICEDGDSNIPILKAKDVDGRGILLRLPGNLCFPFLDNSQCTFATPSDVRITFHMI